MKAKQQAERECFFNNTIGKWHNYCDLIIDCLADKKTGLVTQTGYGKTNRGGFEIHIYALDAKGVATTPTWSYEAHLTHLVKNGCREFYSYRDDSLGAIIIKK